MLAQHAALLALQRHAGNGATAAALGAGRGANAPAVTVQRSKVVFHDYRKYKSPADTVVAAAKQIVGPTAAGAVEGDLDSRHRDTPRGLIARPDRIVAYLDVAPSSAGRKGAPKQDQTKVGHIGDLEDVLRGYGRGHYEGGHLLGYQFNNGLAWDLINRAANLAPQDYDSNQQREHTNWGREEERVAQYLSQGGKVLYEASAEYPDRTYSVWAPQLATVFTGDTQKRLKEKSVFLPYTVNTWIPSQYRIDWTKLGKQGAGALASAAGHVLGGAYHLLWNLSVSRLVGFLGRLSALVGLGRPGAHLFGGVVMDSQRKAKRDAANELKQLLLDITKLSLPFGAVFVGLGVTPGQLLDLIPAEFLASGLGAYLPAAVWQQVPLAALLVYSLAHWSNMGRILPNASWAQWIKWVLEGVGL